MTREIITGLVGRFRAWATAPAVVTLSPPAPVQPPRSLMPVVERLLSELQSVTADQDFRKREAFEMAGELMEAALMGGSGPWLGPMKLSEGGAPGGLNRITEISVAARESFVSSQGANGLFELELNNWEWRREINFSLTEFSRWGIQQIILISRLYYIKNPIVRRLVNVCAIYVFGRGVEISSDDEAVNDEIQRFLERNQKVLGQVALTDLERRKDYDGNLFFVFFGDDKNTGETNVRTIDAVEIQEIVTDPNDADTEWFFHRKWVQRTFNPADGSFATEAVDRWYPAIGYEPTDKPPIINGVKVMWENPVYHRKCGTVGKWLFGCPRIYPMLDWAKASRKFLEACAAVKAALAQISMQITTKGGQQALAGIKQQLETTVGTGNAGWPDQNPTAVNGSIFASGPGTVLSAFKSSGEGGDPEEVRQYKLMCCMVKDVPETFLADVSTGNLATATTLDRPTELAFQSLQEEWREDLIVIVSYAMRNSLKAGNGKLREAMKGRGTVTIREARRIQDTEGRWRYQEAPPAKEKDAATVEVKVTFPAIREGDIPALSAALSAAFATGTVDKRAAALKFCEYFDIEDGQELVNEMYGEDYNPDKEEQANADNDRQVALAVAAKPQILKPGDKGSVKEALERLVEAAKKWK